MAEIRDSYINEKKTWSVKYNMRISEGILVVPIRYQNVITPLK